MATLGPVSAGTVVQTGSGNNWAAAGASVQSDLSTSNDVRSICSTPMGGGQTKALDLTSFSFGSLPSGHAVVGVEAKIEAVSSAGNPEDLVVQLLYDGSLVGVSQEQTTWAAVETMQTYGGSEDLWGVAAGTIEDPALLGLRVQFINKSGTNDFIFVDHIAMTVHTAPVATGSSVAIGAAVGDVGVGVVPSIGAGDVGVN